MNTSTLGSQTEAIILAALVKQGYTVFVPFGGHHRCDFIVDTGEAILKIQCKTGRLRNGVLKWHSVSRDKIWSDKTTKSVGYKEDVDCFIVYCPDNDLVYSVPVGVVPDGIPHLRITPTKNHQKLGIRWAKDYEGLSGLSDNG